MTTFTKVSKFIARESAITAFTTAALQLTTGGRLLENFELAVIGVLVINAAEYAVKALIAARAKSRKQRIQFKVPEFQM